MKLSFVVLVGGALWLAGVLGAAAQSEEVTAGTSSQTLRLEKAFSEKPFLGTKSVLTLGGDYLKPMADDNAALGVWATPFTLGQMHGVVAEIGIGEATKRGEWQLRYRFELMTADTAWQGLNDVTRNFSLAEHRSQVLKVSYNVRDWWQVGFAALVEARDGADVGAERIPLSFSNGESLGFQIDTLLRF